VHLGVFLQACAGLCRKFFCDFEHIQEHKLWRCAMKQGRQHMKFGIAVWCDNVEHQKKMRGIVRRTHAYRHMRRLASAMEDWCYAVSLGRKETLLATADASGDANEVARTMEAVVQGIVTKPRVRQFELQAAAVFTRRIMDIKLHAAMDSVNEALSQKVDKPTAEDIARRTKNPPPKQLTAPPSFSSQLAAAPATPQTGSTMPSGPSAHKYTDTLQALAEAKDKEEKVRKRLEEKKAALKASKEQGVMPHAASGVVVPPMEHPRHHYPEYPGAQAAFEANRAQEKAMVEAKIEAEVAAEMAQAPPGMPVSSTRRLLEKQYRAEMKMKMVGDPAQANPLYRQMYNEAGAVAQGQMERAVLDAAAATSSQQTDARTAAAYGSSALSEARAARELLQSNLAAEAQAGAGAE